MSVSVFHNSENDWENHTFTSKGQYQLVFSVSISKSMTLICSILLWSGRIKINQI